MKPTSDKAAMRSLSHCMEKLTNDGYTANFSVAEEKLQHVESGHSYEAEHVEIVDFYRFEGVSDPEDNSILYAILTSDTSRIKLTLTTSEKESNLFFSSLSHPF